MKTKSPTELAQINSLSEFPVPSSIKNLLSPAERAKKAEEKKRRSEKTEFDLCMLEICEVFPPSFVLQCRFIARTHHKVSDRILQVDYGVLKCRFIGSC